MHSDRPPVYIRSAELGGPFTHRPEASLREQMTEAASRALEQAALAPGEVDAVIVACMGGFDTEEFVGLLPIRVAGDLRLRHADVAPMLMGTSEAGAWALRHAYDALGQGGEVKTVLLIAGEQMNPLAQEQAEASRRERFMQRMARNAVIAQVLDESDTAYGLNMVRVGDLFMDLLQTRLQINAHDLHDLLLPSLALSKYERAARYPMAHFHRAPIDDFEGYVSRPKITTHFNLHDVTPTTTGAVAVVLSTRPPEGQGRRVAIAGMGQAWVPISLGHRRGDLALSVAIRESYARACAAAGTAPDTLLTCDFAVLHDAFPSIEIFFLKELGLALPELMERLLSGWSNPFGGLKACGHALGASGLLQVAKAYHRFTRDARYVRPAPGEDTLPWTHDSLCATTSVGAALTNVISTLITAAAPGDPDPIAARTPEGAEARLARYRAETTERDAYESLFADLAEGEGVVLSSSHLKHTPSFGDDEVPLLATHRDPWVHLVQLPPLPPGAPAEAADKALAFSTGPLEPGARVSLATEQLGGESLHRAVPTDAPPVEALRPHPTDAPLETWVALEASFQRFRRRKLDLFSGPPEALTPHMCAYAALGPAEHAGGVHLLRLKARLRAGEAGGLEAPGPPGEVVTVTLVQPAWEGVRRWLPELFADCERRLDVHHHALPRLFDWGVLPELPAPIEARMHPGDQAPPTPAIYIVREFVEGIPLIESRSRGASAEPFLEDASALAHALALLHRHQLYGRGLSLRTVVRSPLGPLKILDSPWAELPDTAPDEDGNLFEPTEARIARDIHGLGRVLFHLWTGEALPDTLEPVDAESLASALDKGRLDITRFLTRLLSPRGRERLGSMEDVLEAIDAL